MVNADTLATSRPGIFAGGDFITGPRDVIRVIADGRKTALSIHTYLSGEEFEKKPVHFTAVSEVKIDPDLEKIPRQKIDTIPIKERKSVDKEVELGFSNEVAVKEAIRCLQCHIFTIFDRTKCILCGGCVDICPTNCLKLVPIEKLEGDDRVMGTIKGRYGQSPKVGTAMIKNETRCIRCGLCSRRCPTSAITMEAFYFEEQLVSEGAVE